MIPILYAADETTFSHNGIGRLTDCTSCIVTEERNGIFECEFSYPITGAFYNEISLDRLVKVKPNEMSDDQLFRIYRINKPIEGIVNIYCQHISYDLITNVCKPFKLLSATALEALQGILNNCYHSHSFTCQSTASGTHDFEVEVPTAARACLGGTEGSLLDTFGGEFEFDNYLIKLHGHRGQDTGVTILYGKNLTDVKSDTNLSSTYNSIFPYAVDEEDDTPVHTLDGNTKIITISGASTFGEPRTLAVDLTDRFDLTEEDITSAKLQQYANDYLSENDLKSIYQNVEISFVQLWQTEEYKNVALLERVGLCDTVTVRYEKLGIDATAKVIKTVYNVLTEKYEKIELGNVKSNFVDTLRRETEKKIRQADEDNRSALQRAIDNATALITGQEGGHVVINQDSNGKPKEILIMNTDDIQTASKVWRWNLGGLGYSSTGYSGRYGVAMTMDGSIVANYITSGTMSGERIEAGTLSATKITTGIIKDAQGKNYWNLNNGNFRLSQYNALSSLTHDGDAQGIYMVPVQGEDYSELRINANYIKSGTINADLITTGSMAADRITSGQLTDKAGKNYWNLNNGEFRLSATAKVGSTSSSPTLTNYITSTADTNLMTQTKIFNTLTNNGAMKGIYMLNGELYINGTYIHSGVIDADLIQTGTIKSKNGQTSLNMNSGDLTISLSDGNTMSLTGAGLSSRYNNSRTMFLNASQFHFDDVGRGAISISALTGTASFSRGSSILMIKPNSNFTALSLAPIVTDNIKVNKTLEAQSITVPHSSLNNTFIDFKGMSYQGNQMFPVKISVNGTNYIVLGYKEPSTPVQIKTLNLSTTSVLYSKFVALTAAFDGENYVVAAYDTTQSGSGTDITAPTADVSYMNKGFNYSMRTVNNVSYAILTAGEEKSNATTVYDELTDSVGRKYMPMLVYFNGAWRQIYGFRA